MLSGLKEIRGSPVRSAARRHPGSEVPAPCVQGSVPGGQRVRSGFLRLPGLSGKGQAPCAAAAGPGSGQVLPAFLPVLLCLCLSLSVLVCDPEPYPLLYGISEAKMKFCRAPACSRSLHCFCCSRSCKPRPECRLWQQLPALTAATGGTAQRVLATVLTIFCRNCPKLREKIPGGGKKGPWCRSRDFLGFIHLFFM